jgi:hypothetical protein
MVINHKKPEGTLDVYLRVYKEARNYTALRRTIRPIITKPPNPINAQVAGSGTPVTVYSLELVPKSVPDASVAAS